MNKEIPRCLYCTCQLYHGKCEFYLCKGNPKYLVLVERAHTYELADNLNISYEEAAEIHSRNY